MSSDSLFARLNEAQYQAVAHIEGPLLVLAGPGSGKTRVLTHRIAHLIECEIPPRSIVALTFTNKAADEMKGRIEQLAPQSQVWAGTFHKFCSRLLRMYAPSVGLSENFSIYDTSDSRRLVKLAMDEALEVSKHYSADQIASEISRIKSQGCTVQDVIAPQANPLRAVSAQVYAEYQMLLQASNAVDFDDLLLYVAQMLKENESLRAALDERFEYILVDEYQDTNTTQYLILKALSADHRNLCVTGDPDQSIYGWRGASIGNILDFEQDFPDVKVVRLEQNYRSTRSILQVADRLISNNLRRKHKQLVTHNPQGDPVSLIAYPTQQEEAQGVAEAIADYLERELFAPNEVAVFYRVNWLSRSLEHALRAQRVPYQVVAGQEFYARREIKDLLAYLHLLNNPADNVAVGRIINVPPRKIGKVTLGRLRKHARDHSLSLLETARRCGLIESISKQAAAKVAAFVALYDRLSLVKTASIVKILGHVLTHTGYRDYLLSDDSDEAHERAANVDELLTAAREYDDQHPSDGSLESFLEQAVLVNDTDAWEPQTSAVSLMTLHAAKGLEFPLVFIVGLEDGLLPHELSSADPDEIEEERRLLFVGITRAERQLRMSRAMYRFRRGALWPTVASQFLMELPRENMCVVEPGRMDSPHVETDLWSDEDWTEHPDAPRLGPAGKSSQESIAPRILTASQLSGHVDPPTRYPPSAFALGMMVNHPLYGPGKIIALSGSEKKRTASVQFFNGGQRKFRLAQSPLQPIG